MNILTETIISRETFCKERLDSLKKQINSIKELSGVEEYCIYITGSYARKEAHSASDLDLFFVENGGMKLSNIKKTLIDAELIGVQRHMGFPEFSGDGKFLEVHSLQDIVKYLGSPKDDYNNYFTARMLLLLESNPVYNEDYYDQVLKNIIDAYYRDFHGHETQFHPIFLVNDIIRFWKTLCLNYEHRRHRSDVSDVSAIIRRKAHKNNLKLRFSRKMTCFSFLLMIIMKYKDLKSDSVVDIVKMTPVERLVAISKEEPKTKENIKNCLALYSQFLELSSKDEDWIDEKNNRDKAFDLGREFGDEVFKVLSSLTGGNNSDIMKFLIS